MVRDVHVEVGGENKSNEYGRNFIELSKEKI